MEAVRVVVQTKRDLDSQVSLNCRAGEERVYRLDSQAGNVVDRNGTQVWNCLDRVVRPLHQSLAVVVRGGYGRTLDRGVVKLDEVHICARVVKPELPLGFSPQSTLLAKFRVADASNGHNLDLGRGQDRRQVSVVEEGERSVNSADSRPGNSLRVSELSNRVFVSQQAVVWIDSECLVRVRSLRCIGNRVNLVSQAWREDCRRFIAWIFQSKAKLARGAFGGYIGLIS